MRRTVTSIALAISLATACSGGDGGALVLDGSVIEPDDAGVIEALDPTTLTLDGTEYALADELVVFSAGTLASVPLAGRDGHYVLVGLDGDRVEWVAAVGAVLNTDPAQVLFEDAVAEAGDGFVQFSTGLRLALADGLAVPEDGTEVLVSIDPATDTIVEVTPR